MNFITQHIIAVYSIALNLYLYRFKNEFIKEMHSVFRNSVLDAKKGVLALFHMFLAGIIWIAMGGWTITRLSAPVQSEGSA